MTEKLTTVLGTAKGKPRSRLWIEGRRLNAAGFTRGTPFYRVFNAKGSNYPPVMYLTTDEGWALNAGTPREYRVAGKGADHPIIDITGKVITDLFTGTHVEVTFDQGMISVHNAMQVVGEA